MAELALFEQYTTVQTSVDVPRTASATYSGDLHCRGCGVLLMRGKPHRPHDDRHVQLRTARVMCVGCDETNYWTT